MRFLCYTHQRLSDFLVFYVTHIHYIRFSETLQLHCKFCYCHEMSSVVVCDASIL